MNAASICPLTVSVCLLLLSPGVLAIPISLPAAIWLGLHPLTEGCMCCGQMQPTPVPEEVDMRRPRDLSYYIASLMHESPLHQQVMLEVKFPIAFLMCAALPLVAHATV